MFDRKSKRRAPVTLKADREYERKRGQWHRVKKSPSPPKPCIVRRVDGVKMDYDGVGKVLFVRPGNHFQFPSKSEAQKAIWHTAQADGRPGSHYDYVIEEL